MSPATDTQSTDSPRSLFVVTPAKPPVFLAVTTPLPVLETAIRDKRHRDATLLPIDQDKAQAARLASRQHWAELNLRQEWADEAFMRGHLKVAGVRVGSSAEPASVTRMKEKLRAVGIHGPEVHEAVGMPLDRFLEVNPRMPLWAALALVLESLGRFTSQVFAEQAE